MKNFSFQKYANGKTQCILPYPDQYFADLTNGQLITRMREDINCDGNITASGANGTKLNCIIAIVLKSLYKEGFKSNGLPKGSAMRITGKFFSINNNGFVDFIFNSSVSYLMVIIN